MIIKRKGHLLLNPTQQQIDELEISLLRKTRIEQWIIEDIAEDYPNEWPTRDPEIIDTIIIAASDHSQWSSFDLMKLDTSEKNDVTPGKPLPGFSYHIFINSNGLIEKLVDLDKITYHTACNNIRSIGILLQYSVSKNSAPPQSKLIQALIRTLTILSLQFKLNPYNAILGQAEALGKFCLFDSKGHKHIPKESPGPLISMDNIRRETAIMVKKKLKYYSDFKTSIDSKFDEKTIQALRDFNSGIINKLYNRKNIKAIKKGYDLWKPAHKNQS